MSRCQCTQTYLQFSEVVIAEDFHEVRANAAHNNQQRERPLLSSPLLVVPPEHRRTGRPEKREFSCNLNWKWQTKWIRNNNDKQSKCIRCSCSSPWSLILLASCWAFFFRRHTRDAYLFFSRRVRARTAADISADGVNLLMSWASFRSSLPVANSLPGFGVTSLPSPRRALPLCL